VGSKNTPEFSPPEGPHGNWGKRREQQDDVRKKRIATSGQLHSSKKPYDPTPQASSRGGEKTSRGGPPLKRVLSYDGALSGLRR
jgi:hypothetical protein